MEDTKIVYEGIVMLVLYTTFPAQEPEPEVGFKGTYEWKNVEAVMVGGIDITVLLEQHIEAIEKEINK